MRLTNRKLREQIMRRKNKGTIRLSDIDISKQAKIDACNGNKPNDKQK